jgi:hypothetical protein
MFRPSVGTTFSALGSALGLLGVAALIGASDYRSLFLIVAVSSGVRDAQLHHVQIAIPSSQGGASG